MQTSPFLPGGPYKITKAIDELQTFKLVKIEKIPVALQGLQISKFHTFCTKKHATLRMASLT